MSWLLSYRTGYLAKSDVELNVRKCKKDKDLDQRGVVDSRGILCKRHKSAFSRLAPPTLCFHFTSFHQPTKKLTKTNQKTNKKPTKKQTKNNQNQPKKQTKLGRIFLLIQCHSVIKLAKYKLSNTSEPVQTFPNGWEASLGSYYNIKLFKFSLKLKKVINICKTFYFWRELLTCYWEGCLESREKEYCSIIPSWPNQLLFAQIKTQKFTNTNLQIQTLGVEKMGVLQHYSLWAESAPRLRLSFS